MTASILLATFLLAGNPSSRFEVETRMYQLVESALPLEGQVTTKVVHTKKGGPHVIAITGMEETKFDKLKGLRKISGPIARAEIGDAFPLLVMTAAIGLEKTALWEVKYVPVTQKDGQIDMAFRLAEKTVGPPPVSYSTLDKVPENWSFSAKMAVGQTKPSLWLINQGDTTRVLWIKAKIIRDPQP